MSDSMQIEWTQPYLIWLLAIVLPWLVWFHFRSLSDFPRWQRWLSLLCRVCVVALITLAIAGLVWLVPTQRQMIVVAIDRSESIDAAAREVADRFAESLKTAVEAADDVEVRFLPFDRQSGELLESWPPDANRPATDSGPDAAADKTLTAQQTVATGSEVGDIADELPPIPPANESSVASESANLGTDIAAAIRTAVASIAPSYR
ncbi:MAG TPA: chloride channel protein, partial [Planctomycetaceae bacterium]|nr:chloride channel protein [Planctomycetaceae bacterium]